jgi:uncharacterized protein
MKRSLFTICLLCLTAFSYSASFDCSKASTANEKAICSESELSSLDERLSEAYKKALQINPEIKNSQRDWLKSLRACESNSNITECLKNAFKSRLQVMNFLANPNRGIVGLEIKGLVQKNGRTLLEIGSVLANSPAQEAGINQGELISEINGKTFADLGQVFELLNVPAGRVLSFKLIRPDNSELVISVKVAARPSQDAEIKTTETQ